jgi:hypothetical protein
MSKCPVRRIIKRSDFAKVASRGQRFFVYLECGHMEQMTKTEAKSGKCHCFDCFYGKPTHFDPKELQL